MTAARDITGQRFGKLIAVKRIQRTPSGTKWECVCDCGTVTEVFLCNLRPSNTTSCGCVHSEITVNRNTKHGKRYLPEYESWRGMKARCLRKSIKCYKYYGGRGITVCERWLNSFENFFDDMGIKPSPKHSIDRIDVDGDYCKENCKWSTPKEQSNNRRHVINRRKLLEAT